MLKSLRHKCYDIQGCQLDFKPRCLSWDRGANCWDHLADHPCCDRKTWQRCLRCEVWMVADQKELPPQPIRPKLKKLKFT